MKFVASGDKIVDTHVGSANSLLSCHKNGFDYIGFEKDPDMYKDAEKRLEEYRNQINLYEAGMERG